MKRRPTSKGLPDPGAEVMLLLHDIASSLRRIADAIHASESSGTRPKPHPGGQAKIVSVTDASYRDQARDIARTDTLGTEKVSEVPGFRRF
jgi:hypothetical protein